MRLILLFVFLSVSPAFLIAQFGINAGYATHQAPDWRLGPSDGSGVSEPPGNGFSVGIDYWFRLKNVRIEFLPELNYTQLSTPSAVGLETRNHWYSIFANVNFYPFDFKGDCDCPTFSKQGNQLQKGFFISLSPGLSYMDNRISGGWGGVAFEYLESTMAPSMGIGAGIDFGISDLLTVTPYASFRYLLNARWDDIPKIAADRNYDFPGDGTADVRRLQAGLRLGWRFNYR